MSQAFFSLPRFKHSSINQAKSNTSSRYWKSFKHKKDYKLSSAIADVEGFGDNFLICYGSRAEIYDGKNEKAIKAFSKSKEPVTCATMRSDGKLVALGNSVGEIMIFDSESKLHLRTLKGHSNAIRNLKFLPNKLNLVSASDDTTVRLWDVAGSSEVTNFQEHTDYVRALSVSASSNGLFASGSYDGTINIYDAQSSSVLFQINHESPVESIVITREGSTLISAGEATIKFWNLLENGKLMNSIECHQKSISCLQISPDGQFLLSGSLDNHLKIIRLLDYEVVLTKTFPSSIASFSLNSTQICVGLNNGTVAFRIRKQKDESDLAVSLNNFSLSLTRCTEKPEFKANLSLDRYLRKFQYKTAFEYASKINDIHLISSLSQELLRRGGLLEALKGQTTELLLATFDFTFSRIRNPSYSTVIIQLLHNILDVLNSRELEVDIFSLLANRRNQLIYELDIDTHIAAVKGQIDLFIGITNNLNYNADI